MPHETIALKSIANLEKRSLYARLPFYYGWVIMIAAAIGVLASIPGQTMGVSVFTDHLIGALRVTRVEISTAYMIGTLASAFVIPSAGKMFDKFGARIVAGVAAFFLGMFLFLFAYSGTIATTISNITKIAPNYVGVATAVVGFFGIRFFGQGVLTLVSRGMLVQWFSSRRGLAVGIMGLVTAFGYSYAPQPLQYLINVFGWTGALFGLGLGLVFVFIPFVILFFRRNPQSCGLVMEEGLKVRKAKIHAMPDSIQQKTLEQAKKDPRFWMIVLLLWFWALFNTAFTFHVISIFDQTGIDGVTALKIFLPISAFSVAARFIGSYLSDRINLKYLVHAFTISMAIAGVSLSFLGSTFAYILMIIGYGIASGLFGMLNIISWPKIFGKKHVGAISGFAMAFIVAGSAIGPACFSYIFRITGSYELNGVLSILFCFVILILTTKVKFTPSE